MNNFIVEERIIEYDEKRIYGKAYYPKKDGIFPIVIFSHGYNGTHEHFNSYGEFLAANGVAAYCYDFCGGSVDSKSSLKTTEMTIFTEQDDLKAVIKSVKEWSNIDKQNIFLFGGSQGGFVTALTAEEYKQDIRGMILLYPAFCIADDWTNKYEDISYIPDQLPFWGMNLGGDYIRAVHGLNVKEHIGDYDNNVLILHGDEDAIVSQKYSMDMVKQYKKGKLIIFPREGHGFSAEGNKKVQEMTLQFVKENWV